MQNGGTWIDAATQIFFAYSVGVGALPALGSYNRFNHNCFRYNVGTFCSATPSEHFVPQQPPSSCNLSCPTQLLIIDWHIEYCSFIVKRKWFCKKIVMNFYYISYFNLKFFLHFRDAVITCIVNTCTCLTAGVLVFSILGYMAHLQGVTVHDVARSGPGLVFLTYPELVLTLNGSFIWAILFFAMLLVRRYYWSSNQYLYS